MAYVPPPGNVSSSVGLMSWVNSSLLNQMFFPGLLVAVFIIIVSKLMFNNNTISRSFAAASFVCMILSVLLRITNLLNTNVMVIFIIFTAISSVWMHMENLG